MKELYEQGERIENINRNLDNINQDLKETKKNISNMRSFFSRIKSKFGSSSRKDQVSDSNGSANLISHNNNVKRFNFESTTNEASNNNNKFETITNSEREKGKIKLK